MVSNVKKVSMGSKFVKNVKGIKKAKIQQKASLGGVSIYRPAFQGV